MRYKYCFRQGLVERGWDMMARDTTLGATAFTSYGRGVPRDVIVNDSWRRAKMEGEGHFDSCYKLLRTYCLT